MQSTKTKSKKAIFKQFLVGMLAVAAAFLIFTHDIIERNLGGYLGFSSLRVMVWTISLFLFGIIGWLKAFIHAKGKIYRFTYLIPVLVAIYQLLVYIFDARESKINSFNIKAIFTLAVSTVVAIFIFELINSKKKEKKNPNRDFFNNKG